MKCFLQLLICCLCIAMPSQEIYGLSKAITILSAAPSTQQNFDQARADLYKKFTDNIKTRPDVAYEAGKEYLSKYEAQDGPQDQYVAYIKKWVAAYEKRTRRDRLLQQIKDKNYDAAFAASKQVLADFPDDLALVYELSKAGLFAATGGNEANNADAINYAKKTIQLIQSGKTFEKDKPIERKDEILGGLNFELGFFLKESQPAEAITYFINAAQLDGPAKKDPQTYVFLAELYQTTEYRKLAAEYTARCETEEQQKSQVCEVLLGKVNRVVDLIIDAVARAVAYSDMAPDPAKHAQVRTVLMESLTKYYKFRHDDSDVGLKELLAGITSKPLPKPAGQSQP